MYVHICSFPVLYIMDDYIPLLLPIYQVSYISHFAAPSQGVRNIYASVISPNEVNLMWMPPYLQNWNGVLTNYTVGECIWKCWE